jgi:hypothetical protein
MNTNIQIQVNLKKIRMSDDGSMSWNMLKSRTYCGDGMKYKLENRFMIGSEEFRKCVIVQCEKRYDTASS